MMPLSPCEVSQSCGEPSEYFTNTTQRQMR